MYVNRNKHISLYITTRKKYKCYFQWPFLGLSQSVCTLMYCKHVHMDVYICCLPRNIFNYWLCSAFSSNCLCSKEICSFKKRWKWTYSSMFNMEKISKLARFHRNEYVCRCINLYKIFLYERVSDYKTWWYVFVRL
jgi:hypothetical protein